MNDNHEMIIKKNNSYTAMSNYHLRDKTLSYKAKGLLSFMLSLPEKWNYSVKGLVAVSKENIKAISSTLKELEEHKYLLRIKKQSSTGRFIYKYYIYEIPYTKKGCMEEGCTEKEHQINTNIINTNKDKIDKTGIINELIKRRFIEESDLELYRYNDLFINLLKKYDYIQVMIATNYIIKKWVQNSGKDENGFTIENKFEYFKIALENNLIRLNIDDIFDLE